MEQTNSTPGQNSSFVAFRLPGEPDFHLWIGDSNLTAFFSPENLHQDGFLFHPFLISKEFPAIFLKPQKKHVNKGFSFFAGPGEKASAIDKTSYLKKADQFINATSGEFLKLVLSRTMTIENNGSDLGKLFFDLQKQQPHAFVYLFNHPLTGCWMGASPEVLIRGNQEKITTVALAGTKLFDPEDENGYWSAKDRLEQDIVVKYIENILKARHIRFEKSDPKDHRAGHLVHLKTSFHFSKPNDIYGLILGLHPTPAVCGLPKDKAFGYILENEQHDRAYYAGFYGPVSSEQKIDLFVNLRCMKITAEQFVLYAGSGIIPDSDAESEWEETNRKFQTMRNIILKSKE